MANETQSVQMRLRTETMERLNTLQTLMGEDNRAQIIATAIELAAIVIENMETGGKVYMETPCGDKIQIKAKYPKSTA